MFLSTAAVYVILQTAVITWIEKGFHNLSNSRLWQTVFGDQNASCTFISFPLPHKGTKGQNSTEFTRKNLIQSRCDFQVWRVTKRSLGKLVLFYIQSSQGVTWKQPRRHFEVVDSHVSRSTASITTPDDAPVHRHLPDLGWKCLIKAGWWWGHL